jgi:ribonuclease P/MRP protein subunit RPP1
MYEAVRVYPDGETTVARFAGTAARYGYDGIVVRATGPAPTGVPHTDDAAGVGPTDGTGAREGDGTGDRDDDPDPAGAGSDGPPAYAAIREAYGVDVVDGVEVRADGPQGASGAVGNYRRDRTLVLVRGGTDALNRFAVEQDRVDVLTRPFGDSGTDGDVNHVLAKAAREHGVRLEFALGPVLRASGGQRVRALRNLRKLRELVAHYDAPFVVSAVPASHLQVRAPRALRAVGDAIGMDPDRVEAGLAEWGRLAARNRDRVSPAFVEPGVRRGRYDPSDWPDGSDDPTGGDD